MRKVCYSRDLFPRAHSELADHFDLQTPYIDDEQVYPKELGISGLYLWYKATWRQ